MLMRLAELFRGESPAHLLARGSTTAFLIHGVGAGLLFFSEIVLARLMTTADYGLYATVMSWLQVLVIVALLGSNQVLLRFVSVYVASAKWALLHGVLRQSWRGSLVLAIGIYIVAAISLWLAGTNLSPETRVAFLIGLAALPLQALAYQRQAILRSLHRVAPALLPEHIVRPLLLMVLVLALAWGIAAPLSASQGLLMNGIAVAVAFTLGWYWQQRAMPGEVRSIAPEFRSREWLHIALPLFLIDGTQLLISRLDIIMLGAMAGHEPAGIYTAASRISYLVAFALVSASAIVIPMIASMYARNDMAGLQHVMTLLAKGLLLLTVPLAVLLWVFGPFILSLFGAQYEAGYLPLVILVCAQMISALSGPVVFLMAMTGHQVQAMRILIMATVLNFVLNFALIPLYGMLGAAIATAVSIMLWNLLMLRFVRNRMGIDSSILSLFGRNREVA